MRGKVITAINQYKLINSGDTVIVGLSGGADSMALVHCLNSLKNDFNFSLVAVHLNHCIRGNEADSDETIANHFCKLNDIPFKAYRRDIIKEAKQKKIGLEEYGRIVRYEIFNEVASEFAPNAKIATAHTASDNIETMIFNMCRGCSVSGLKGIVVKRDNIIRPILSCTREEIELYCKQNKITYVTDSSNLSDDYTRNYIRHNIVPHLKNVNPNAELNALKLSSFAREDEEYFKQKVDIIISKSKIDYNSYNLEIIKGLEKPLINRFVFSLVKNIYNISLGKSNVEEIVDIIKKGKGKKSLNSNLFAVVTNSCLKFQQEIKGNEKPFESYNINKLPVIVKTLEKTVEFDCEEVDLSESLFNIHKKLFNIALDYDTIIGNLVLRNKIAGDSFTLCNRGVSKSLKKLFNELKIPTDKREKLFVLECNGQIAFIESIGVSEKFKVTNKTKRILKIDFTED